MASHGQEFGPKMNLMNFEGTLEFSGVPFLF